jgi:hypothetical protein
MPASRNCLPEMQVSFHTINGRWSHVQRNVTVQRGSWRWQDAFKVAAYTPRQGRRGIYWKSSPTLSGRKLPIAKWAREHMVCQWGTLRNRPAAVGGVDDYGNLFFVVD